MNTVEYIGISFGILGIILVLVVAFMAITVLRIPKIVVKTAPKDIQEKVLQRPDGPLWDRVVGIMWAIVIILSIIIILIWVGYDAVQRNISFGLIFLRYVILLVGYKLFDIICFDWILLTKLTIFQKLFPETSGCKGFENFGFNFKSQIVKIIAFILLSALMAAIIVHL